MTPTTRLGQHCSICGPWDSTLNSVEKRHVIKIRDGEQSKSTEQEHARARKSKRRSDEEEQRAAKFHPKSSSFRAF